MDMHGAGLGLAAWREAWLARRDNPLPRLWRLGQSRVAQRRAWWRVAPGLTWLGATISAVVTYLLVLIIRQFLALHESALATTSYALGLLRAGTLMLACGALVLGGCWLLVRLHACAYLALSLLGRTRRKGSAVLDDALLSSTLSNEQVVLGLVTHAWRMLLPPALVLNIANAAVYFAWVTTSIGADMARNPTPPVPWTQALLLALAILLWQTIAAGVGATLLMLLLLMLGRGAGPLAPATGAATLSMLQLGLWGGLPYIGSQIGISEVMFTGWLQALLSVAVASGLFYFYFWVAHHSPPLRNATAHTLLVLLVPLVVMAPVLSVLPCAGFGLLTLFSGFAGSQFATMAIAAIITFVQVVLILPLALLARDAVRLHRGGAA